MPGTHITGILRPMKLAIGYRNGAVEFDWRLTIYWSSFRINNPLFGCTYSPRTACGRPAQS